MLYWPRLSEDLSLQDITKARQIIHAEIRHQKTARRILNKSIRRLERALDILSSNVESSDGPDIPDYEDKEEFSGADVDGDGSVTLLDIALLNRHWLKTCEDK